MEIENIRNDFPTFNVTVITVLYTTDIKIVVENNHNKKVFQNSVNIKLGNKSLKFFKNGKILVTGCKNFSDIEDVTKYLSSAYPHNKLLKSPEVCMINTNVKMDSVINLEELKKHLKTVETYTNISYNPCKYQAVKATLCDCKLLIFHSGAVCAISKNLQNIHSALKFLRNDIHTVHKQAIINFKLV